MFGLRKAPELPGRPPPDAVRIGREALAVFGLFGLLWGGAVAAADDCQEQRAATIPLQDAPRPIVEVKINGKSIPMYVDTGSMRSAISPAWAAELRLRHDPRHRDMVKSMGGEDLSSEAIVTKLDIAGLDFFDKGFVVSELPAEGPGVHAAGVIGADIINDFDLELDMPRRTLTLYKVGDCRITRPPWFGAYAIAVGSASNNRFRLPVQLNGHLMMALFDTGSMTETVSLDAARRAGVWGPQLDADRVVAETTAGAHTVEAHRHQFASLKIGAHVFANPVMNVVDFDQSGVDMLVGADYMKLGRFFLAYSTSTIYIQTPLDSADIARRHPADGGSDWRGPCWLPADVAPLIAPDKPAVLDRPKAAPPPRAVADRIDGCAGVMFHLGADGTPTDLKLVMESPPNYGIGEAVLRQIAATRYQPNPTETSWYYEARRFHFSTDNGLFGK